VVLPVPVFDVFVDVFDALEEVDWVPVREVVVREAVVLDRDVADEPVGDTVDSSLERLGRRVLVPVADSGDGSEQVVLVTITVVVPPGVLGLSVVVPGLGPLVVLVMTQPGVSVTMTVVSPPGPTGRVRVPSHVPITVFVVMLAAVTGNSDTVTTQDVGAQPLYVLHTH